MVPEPHGERAATRSLPSPGRDLSWSNLKRIYKVLKAVRFFRGHRYVFLRVQMIRAHQ